MNKTIVFVMPRFPFPASSGRKTSLYHYCRILSEELGYRLVVLAFPENGDDISLKPDFIHRMEVLKKPSSFKKLKQVALDSVLLRKYPMQVALYLDKEAKAQVKKIVDEEKPAFVIGDMVRSTEYIRDLNCVRIADLDDRISLRYQRELEEDVDKINPYGAFINSVPKFLSKIMLLKPIKLYVMKNEIKLLKKYELSVGKDCDYTVFVAKSEAENFNKELKEDKAFAVPIGVDVDYFSYRETGNDGDYIGFLGAMSVAHNENAVRHFISDILPYIVYKKPDVKFLVIGGGASDDLKKLVSKNVEFTGRVEDVRDYLQKCKLFVCPMTFGSGIKTKNLEAMAMGLPIVTTTIGAENINAVPGKDWIVTDKNKEFANECIGLLSDDTKRIEMGKASRRFVENSFTWDVAKNCFEELLK